MAKKNIIYVLIDSLNYKHLKESKVNLMPYFQSLKPKALFCENMFSEAPYTEAALMSSFCGQDVLDHNGYINRFRDTPITVFEAMKEKGYYTYTTSYSPQCFPTSLMRGVDEYQYNVGYDPAALWSYRFYHYADLNKNGKMTDKDFEEVYLILEDNFKAWLEWLDDLKNNRATTHMIGTNSKSYDVDLKTKQVLLEKEKFEQDKKQYALNIFSEGTKHLIFKIGGFKQDNKAKNRDNVNIISKELNKLAKRIQKMDYRLNKKNCKGYKAGPRNKFKQFIKHPSMTTLKNYAKAWLGARNVLHDLDLKERVNKQYDSFKDGPSFRTHIDTFIKWVNGYDKKQPYFAILHVDDIHNPEEFFTYDSDDIDLLKEEIANANALLDEIPEDYYGSLTHDLSLRYIDGVVKYLYENLAKANQLENTIVMLCADHGFSFSGNPVRDSYVVNFYLENYNIPFLVTGSDYQGVQIDKLCQSKDIPSTLCDLADGVVPKGFSGRSVLRDDNYDSVIVEYCGGGCPDIMRRELMLAAFNFDYFVGTLGTVEKEINITEVYDLKKDPRQFVNLVNDKELLNTKEIQKLLERIEERRKSIKEKALQLILVLGHLIFCFTLI